jgi:hypothetical protein
MIYISILLHTYYETFTSASLNYISMRNGGKTPRIPEPRYSVEVSSHLHTFNQSLLISETNSFSKHIPEIHFHPIRTQTRARKTVPVF